MEPQFIKVGHLVKAAQQNATILNMLHFMASNSQTTQNSQGSVSDALVYPDDEWAPTVQKN